MGTGRGACDSSAGGSTVNWSDRKDACGGSTLGLCLIKASKRSSMFTASQALP